jgi:hypothetical protein
MRCEYNSVQFYINAIQKTIQVIKADKELKLEVKQALNLRVELFEPFPA